MADRQSYIIAVTGGRDYIDEAAVAAGLIIGIDSADRLGRRPILLTGGCPTGLDELARQWWHRVQRPYVVDPARFAKYGRAAGPQRNGRMAIGATFAMDPPFHADVLLVFPGGDGTRNCRQRFEAMGVPIVEIDKEMER